MFLSCNIFAAENVRMTPVVKIVKEWSPAVVNISTESVVMMQAHPLLGQLGVPSEFNTMPMGTMNLKSVGSGVVISKEGLILTNAHVVQMASRIYILLSDLKQAEAVAEAISPEDDLAIIRIKPPEALKPVKIANDVFVGETVVAIGNQLGLENSVSAGIVSGLNRNILSNGKPILTGLIQTDASINQGSSGGALFNLSGELVGINLAIVQGANSVGLAIPFDKVKKFLQNYRDGKLNAPRAQVPQNDQGAQQPNAVRIKIQ
ncbi:MAG: trypsin-like peptidase domain-containing protein [Candidatus Omnitrophica bacterium]|nr:trypsin-like peptidase domain-containing protein [Candidatus Omnitrophota bacterium]